MNFDKEKAISYLESYCNCYDNCLSCPLKDCPSCLFKHLDFDDLKAYLIIAVAEEVKRGDMTPAKAFETFGYIARENSERIKIKYFVKDLEPVVFKGDWCDLRSAEDYDLKAGEYKLLRLGVGMILPDGYEAIIAPRSSTAKNFGIIMANSIGVIDNKYSGDADEWRFPAVAIRDTHIEKNSRICQFRIQKNQPVIEFKEVEHLNEESRGGIGSTGTK